MAAFVAQEEVHSRRISAILLIKAGIFVKHISLAVAIFVTAILPFVARLMLHFWERQELGILKRFELS